MTQMITPTYDVLGIGFGPSNLALAIALQEQARREGRHYHALFLDKQADYRWHGNTLVAQSELQISFLKDLVTLRNPTSPYSFVNYLHAMGRLIDFTNLGTFYPCRMEYNDYLRWVSEQFAEQRVCGETVSRVEPVQGLDGIELVKVLSTDARGHERFRLARSVVVSTGGTPRFPSAFSHLRDDPRVFHHARYLECMAKQRCNQNEPMRIAVIGGGQSAAEAFIDLNDSFPSVKVDMVLRAAVLKPADDSPFVNEIFAPRYTDLVFNEPKAEREKLIQEFHNTNYSVVDLDLIERIYGIFYRQKVAGVDRHAFLCRRNVEAAKADAEARARTEDLRNALLSSISHDLRTPLAAILASATSLREFDGRFEAAVRLDLADTIREEAERLDATVANLLSMSRLEAGQLTVAASAFNVPEVVERAVARRNRGEQRPFDLRIDPATPEDEGDPVLFEQAFGNVVENALRYSPTGAPIAVTVAGQGREVVVEVTDSGPGVAPDEAERIFEKFYRASGARGTAGTGLGLAISRGLLAGMGGRIGVRNRDDGASGLVATLSLKAAA